MALSRVKWSPLCRTTLPVKSFLMISIDSNIIADADADLRPLAADDVLVERLARAETQPEPVRIHGSERGGGLGDHRRVVAKGRDR